jgi:hypothetical protein
MRDKPLMIIKVWFRYDCSYRVRREILSKIISDFKARRLGNTNTFVIKNEEDLREGITRLEKYCLA